MGKLLEEKTERSQDRMAFSNLQTALLSRFMGGAGVGSSFGGEPSYTQPPPLQLPRQAPAQEAPLSDRKDKEKKEKEKKDKEKE